MAIPHHRSLYILTFAMRVISTLLSATILGLVATFDKSFYYAQTPAFVWGLCAPTAALAAAWSLIDIMVLLVKDRGLAWRQSDRRKQERRRREPGSAFCWGSPAVHVCAHLAVWVPTTVLCGLLWYQWFTVRLSDRRGEFVVGADGQMELLVLGITFEGRVLWILAALQIPLM